LADAPQIKVYAGLSLNRAEVAGVLPDALFAGPVGRGDIAEDLTTRVSAIVIIDGRFFQSLAVAPGELMDALRRGVRVYGCSSMGALRAAELAPYGMQGHGKIFELIRDQPVFRDDLLGQIFQESPLRPLTVPYVDLHFALRGLEARGLATRRASDAILHAAAELPFPERDRLRIEEALVARHGKASPALLELLRRGLGGARQKRLDALSTLRRVRADLRDIRAANQRLHRLDSKRLRSSATRKVPR
jgi:hypothetical protein